VAEFTERLAFGGAGPDMVIRDGCDEKERARRIIRDGTRPNDLRDAAFRRVIRSIPEGKVSTYGRIAAAAGYPLYHRAVARLLRMELPSLPWQRVVGVGGEIKLRGEAGLEQRLRLTMENVCFHGKRVDMEAHEHFLRPWET
jgi:methylated-DNA-protein-cysteine methyltransferase-like protein